MDHAPACKLRDREVGRDGANDLDLADLLLPLDEGMVHTTSDQTWEQPPPPICTRARLEGQIAVHARVISQVLVSILHRTKIQKS